MLIERNKDLDKGNHFGYRTNVGVREQWQRNSQQSDVYHHWQVLNDREYDCGGHR